ncbi:MAG: aquaporin [Alphaproteobacteria bacterium]|jgi:MIP family channel proteins|nr:aquaporin [Alphaproteobacteria bacterium]
MSTDTRRLDDWRKYLSEFIGTFTIVFFAAGSWVASAMTDGSLGTIGPGIISGLGIMIVIYAFGHISGAHVNPALSIAAALIGHHPWRLVPGYVIAQMGGSALAGMCLLWALGLHADMGANQPNIALGITPLSALLIETFMAFLLMWVVAGVGLDKRAHGPFAGVAVGAVVGVEVMLMAPIAGAAMNPARAFGPHLARGSFDYYWIYIAGPLIGMALGAYVYRFTHALGNRPV